MLIELKNNENLVAVVGGCDTYAYGVCMFKHCMLAGYLDDVIGADSGYNDWCVASCAHRSGCPSQPGWWGPGWWGNMWLFD